MNKSKLVVLFSICVTVLNGISISTQAANQQFRIDKEQDISISTNTQPQVQAPACTGSDGSPISVWTWPLYGDCPSNHRSGGGHTGACTSEDRNGCQIDGYFGSYCCLK